MTSVENGLHMGRVLSCINKEDHTEHPVTTCDKIGHGILFCSKLHFCMQCCLSDHHTTNRKIMNTWEGKKNFNFGQLLCMKKVFQMC